MANFTQRPAPVKGRKRGKRPNIFIRILKAIFPWKGDSVGEAIRKVIFAVAIVAFVITGGSVLLDVGNEMVQKYVKTEEIRQLKDSLNLSEEEIQKIEQEVPQILPEYMGLYSQNKDIVGWIKLDDTEINYPVMQTSDNEYYLTHNFQNEYSKGGSIFVDYRNTINAQSKSPNLILYGHNIWSGEYFAKLTRYYDSKESDPLAFYKEHPTITFDTIYEKAEYKIFACVLFNTKEKYGEVYPYTSKREFKNKDDFNNFILDIMDRSVLWTDVDLEYGDELITLSTCYWPYGEDVDTRCVVFARKVRDGESPEVDVTKAQRNYNPLCFEYQYKVLGGQWNGRTWDTSKLLSYEGQ